MDTICGRTLNMSGLASLFLSTDVGHGGPDDGPPITWDFSSNANAVTLPAAFHDRLIAADRTRYPDPAYSALRQHLANATGSVAACILPTAGSSEGIRRLTLAASLRGVREVWVPVHAYADHVLAASALSLQVRRFDPYLQSDCAELESACSAGPVLVWLCEPCNPTGLSLPDMFVANLMALARQHGTLIIALDRAYAPLRLAGDDAISSVVAATHCWQCWSPNKSLGLTGVRAGWIQAPVADPLGLTSTMLDLAPSWVLSAEGVRMLSHWHDPDIQHWVASARRTLTEWLALQQGALAELGWLVSPTQVPFFLARPPLPPHTDAFHDMLISLRRQGIKLRDASNFGLHGQVRLRVHLPQAQRALFSALTSWRARHPTSEPQRT